MVLSHLSQVKPNIAMHSVGAQQDHEAYYIMRALMELTHRQVLSCSFLFTDFPFSMQQAQPDTNQGLSDHVIT